MKKLFVTILAVVAVFGFMNVAKAEVQLPEKMDKDPVKVYLFYADYCSHCHEFMEYFLNNYKDAYKDYFEIVTLEADLERKKNDPRPDDVEANNRIAERLRKHFEMDKSEFGWPFIVVGDYTHCGFGSSTGEAIIKKALLQYQKDDYEDVVAKYISEEKQASPKTLKEGAVIAGIVVPDDNDVSSTILISVILVVVIGGLVGLVALAKKN